MTLEQAIKNRLLELCQEKNITLAELGAVSKVDPAITAAIETGTIEETPYQAMVQLCQGLGIQVPDFFCNATFRNLERS